MSDLIKRLRDVGERTLSNVGFSVTGENAVAFGALLMNAADALAARPFSHSPRPEWVNTDERNPDDEQTVLGCWRGPSVCNEGMETLIYHAADEPGRGDVWRDVFGEKRDPPTHWTLMEMPK